MKRKRKHVLFVCVGNLCRSPMAEALGRKYGSDVMVPWSAGLAPASIPSHPLTDSVLREKNVELGEHAPRAYGELRLSSYDLIVNISGRPLPDNSGVRVETWDVADPIGQPEDFFRQTRDQIEMLVMHLILRIRTGKFDSGAGNSRQ